MKDSEEEQKIESRRTVERELNEKGRKSWAEAASTTEYTVVLMEAEVVEAENLRWVSFRERSIPLLP